MLPGSPVGVTGCAVTSLHGVPFGDSQMTSSLRYVRLPAEEWLSIRHYLLLVSNFGTQQFNDSLKQKNYLHFHATSY